MCLATTENDNICFQLYSIPLIDMNNYYHIFFLPFLIWLFIVLSSPKPVREGIKNKLLFNWIESEKSDS